jgi:hypothetical protein
MIKMIEIFAAMLVMFYVKPEEMTGEDIDIINRELGLTEDEERLILRHHERQAG